MEFVMAFMGICPYLKDSRSRERTVCECAKFTFPDNISRRDIIYKYCGHPTGWEKCMFKSVLDGYYERKYSAEGEFCDMAQGTSGSKQTDKARLDRNKSAGDHTSEIGFVRESRCK